MACFFDSGKQPLTRTISRNVPGETRNPSTIETQITRSTRPRLTEKFHIRNAYLIPSIYQEDRFRLIYYCDMYYRAAAKMKGFRWKNQLHGRRNDTVLIFPSIVSEPSKSSGCAWKFIRFRRALTGTPANAFSTDSRKWNGTSMYSQ